MYIFYVAVKFLVHVSIGIKISVDVFHTLTRKHSSRMHSARLPTVGASVAIRCQYQWTRGGPQANKFEQVSSDDHQMSLAGGQCLMWG